MLPILRTRKASGLTQAASDLQDGLHDGQASGKPIRLVCALCARSILFPGGIRSFVLESVSFECDNLWAPYGEAFSLRSPVREVPPL